MRTVIITLILATSFFSCRKEKASWDSDWRVPLIHDSLNLSKLVTDSILSINSDGSYHLVINRDILNLKIDSLLQLPDTSIIQKVVLSLPSATIAPGFSFLNQAENHGFEIKDLILKKVILSQGQANVHISSPISESTIITITLPSVKKNNVVYTRTITAPAGSISNPSIVSEVLDLSGYEIDLTGTNGNLSNIIQSQISVQSDPNGSNVTVTNQDTIYFKVEFKNLIPSYARGYFGNRLYSDTTTFDFDMLNSVVAGSIDLENVSLSISLRNGLKVSARARFSLVENDGASGNSVPLSHSEIGPWILLNQATGAWNNLIASVHTINFTSGNSNIEPFIENIPKFMRIGYAFELNPWGNTSGGWDEFFSTSQVLARLTADMPLAIGMNNLTYADTFNLKYDNTGQNISIKEGNIEVETHSSYSFDATLMLDFIDKNNVVLFTKTGSEKIKGSTNLHNNSSPKEIMKSKVYLTLTDTEVEQLKSIDKLVVKAIFDTPQSGSIATFYDGQFIAFKLFTNIKLTSKF